MFTYYSYYLIFGFLLIYISVETKFESVSSEMRKKGHSTSSWVNRLYAAGDESNFTNDTWNRVRKCNVRRCATPVTGSVAKQR